MPDEQRDLRDLNQRFYSAHETRDLELMASLWSHGPDVVCIHPGWPILRGWDAVEESWRRIFAGPADNQFIVTNDQLNIASGVAWMTLDENLMSAGGTGTIAATNIFLRIDRQWKMVHHHGSPVATQRRQT
ncbi:MAG: nuclear transport factor 2 family protein [Acidimicrobiales bacterium]|nr:nuclear transport factor 2 family protein [Acidimicrobiales bacterium]